MVAKIKYPNSVKVMTSFALTFRIRIFFQQFSDFLK